MSGNKRAREDDEESHDNDNDSNDENGDDNGNGNGNDDTNNDNDEDKANDGDGDTNATNDNGNDDTASTSNSVKKSSPQVKAALTPKKPLHVAPSTVTSGKTSSLLGNKLLSSSGSSGSSGGVGGAATPAKKGANVTKSSSSTSTSSLQSKPTKPPAKGFALYKSDKTGEKKQQYDGKPVMKEINAELKSEWEDLDDDAKEVYEKRAKSLLAKYNQDLKKWKSMNPNWEREERAAKEEKERKKESRAKAKEAGGSKGKKAAKSEGNGSKRQKKEKKEADPDAPKKPLTAFFLFMQDERPKLAKAGLKGAEVAKEGGRLWKDLSTSQKDVYNQKHKQLKVKYDKELAIFEATKGDPSQRKLIASSNGNDTDDNDEATADDNATNDDD